MGFCLTFESMGQYYLLSITLSKFLMLTPCRPRRAGWGRYLLMHGERVFITVAAERQQQSSRAQSRPGPRTRPLSAGETRAEAGGSRAPADQWEPGPPRCSQSERALIAPRGRARRVVGGRVCACAGRAAGGVRAPALLSVWIEN